jgi:DNA-binding transcriptional LysR family regulator
MKLDHLDLNLLLAFDVLASERSVTRAAARIGVSQPAMSGSLARLRAVFGDRLFERAPGGIQPTPRARQLAGPVGEALGRLRAALEPGPAFEPASARQEFRLGASDYAEAVLLPPVVQALARSAPGISLRAVRAEKAFAAPAEALRTGRADLYLGLTMELPGARSELRATPLGHERVVGLLRASHPLAKRKLGVREFARQPQIRIDFAGDDSLGMVDALLASRGIERTVALTVSHLTTVPAIVAGSDLLGVVPEQLARAWVGEGRVRILELPLGLPPLVRILMWHERRAHDAAIGWLRGAIESALAPRDRRGQGSA